MYAVGQSPKGGVVMNKYEISIVLKPNLDDEAKKAENEKIQELITKFGGTIEKTDDWGKRRLAYEIKKFTEGFYTFHTVEAESTLPADMEQRLRIDENVLRYLVIRLN